MEYLDKLKKINMKKIILILMIIISKPVHCQILSVNFDVKNAFYGSKVNKPSLDLLLKYEELFNSEKIEITFFYEHFGELKFSNFGTQLNYRILNLEKTKLLIGLETSIIYRNYNKNCVSYVSYGYNTELRQNVYKNIGIALNYNIKKRTDQLYWNSKPKFVKSFYFGLFYEF